MLNFNRSHVISWFTALVLTTFAVLLNCCSKSSPPLFTGKDLSANTVVAMSDAGLPLQTRNGAQVSKSSTVYAEISYAGLPAYADRYRAELSRKGVPVNTVTGVSGWDKRFNCTLFSDFYVTNAGFELYTYLFQSYSKAQKPAMLVVWYMPDDSPVLADGSREGHAIAQVMTDQGPKFVDPQSQRLSTGEVSLSLTELASIYHRQG